MNATVALNAIDDILRRRAVGELSETQAMHAIQHLVQVYEIHQWSHLALPC